MMNLIRLALVSLFLVITLSAQEGLSPEELYRKGDYPAARQAYLLTSPKDGRVEYNLGNCLYRMSQPGRALVRFERARKWLPRDQEVLANIRLCRKALGLDLTGSVPFLLTFKSTLTGFTAPELVLLACVGSVLTFLGLILRKLWVKSLFQWLSLTGLLLMLLFGSQILYRTLDSSSRGMVIAEEVPVKAEPRKDLEPVATLRAGVPLQVLGSDGEWARIQSGEHKGWLPRAAFGLLDLQVEPWVKP